MEDMNRKTKKFNPKYVDEDRMNEELDMEQEILDVLKKHDFIDDNDFVYKVSIEIDDDGNSLVTVDSYRHGFETSRSCKTIESWRDKVEKALSG